MHDSNGILPRLEDFVAFNRSGEIWHGQIIKITEGQRYGRPYKLFTIKRSKDKGLSKVTNPKNLMVIGARDLLQRVLRVTDNG